MKIHYSSIASTFILIACAVSTTAGPITLVDQGMAPPPGAVGGYSLSSFAPDITPIGGAVTFVGSGAQTLQFDNPVVHFAIGNGWSSWSHGYAGSVYWFDQIVLGDTLTLSLPNGARAFQFYIQPNFFGLQAVNITAGNGGALQDFGSFSLDGNGGAKGFGLFVSPGDAALSVITITGASTFPDGFALGEFSINTVGGQSVPDGGIANWMLASALMTLAAMRRLGR